MSPDIAVWIGFAGAVVGGLLGAVALTQPRYALKQMGLEAARIDGLSEYRAFGGLLLGAHGVTAALLLQAPQIGACMAGALAMGWAGAAFGRLVSRVRDGGPAPWGYFALDVAMAAALAAPLWRYVTLIRAGG